MYDMIDFICMIFDSICKIVELVDNIKNSKRNSREFNEGKRIRTLICALVIIILMVSFALAYK